LLILEPPQEAICTLAATNKSLAQSNKSGADGKATKQRKTEHIEHWEGVGHELRSTWQLSSDYKKRRSAFLQHLIASTPNVSLRAKEFRRWIDENSPKSDNDEA
jgi:hypothetical protein